MIVRSFSAFRHDIHRFFIELYCNGRTMYFTTCQRSLPNMIEMHDNRVTASSQSDCKVTSHKFDIKKESYRIINERSKIFLLIISTLRHDILTYFSFLQ